MNRLAQHSTLPRQVVACSKLHVTNLGIVYALCNRDFIFIYSYHCSCILSLLFLSSLVLHPIETVLVFLQPFTDAGECGVTTVPESEKLLVSAY